MREEKGDVKNDSTIEGGRAPEEHTLLPRRQGQLFRAILRGKGES